MSHTAKMDTKLTNAQALRDTCRDLGIPPPTHEAVTFFDGRVIEGTAVRLKGWQYPVVVGTDGGITYDDYHGHWGRPEILNEFRQRYALSVVRQTMGTHRIETHVQEDGSLRVVLSR